jgi:putative transport protein
MSEAAQVLRDNPELAIFLTLALGFVIGRIKVGSFVLGNVVGTLLAGVLVGQLAITVAPIVKVVFFDLFLFATGYKVGPQFFRGLKKNAGPQVLVTLVLCLTSLLVTFAAAKIFRYDCGTAAGLMAGAFTESTVIGTAGDTIRRLDLTDPEKTRLLNNIPVAYAVSYLVGTGFVVWFLSVLAPRLLKVSLPDESQKLEAQLAGGHHRRPFDLSGYRAWDVRAFQLGFGWTGRTVGDFEQSFPGQRVFVQRIRRGRDVLAAGVETALEDGDTIAVMARRHVFFTSPTTFDLEVEDPELLQFPLTAVDVVLTNGELADLTIGELAGQHGRGIALLKLIRGGEEIPFSAETILNRGDLLRIAGTPEDVQRAGSAFGYIERGSSETDVVFLGIGILVGGLVGLLSVTVATVPLSLTTSGGALIMGLVFGWLRSVRPTFGRIPEPALWVFDTIGLSVFIGIVGLSAGPSFISGLRETGPSLVVVAFVVAALPHLCTVLFGRYVLHMNPVILLGASAGAGTATAALRAIQDQADSKLPVLGYTVPYAIGNILLTAWGPVIVILTK